MQEIDITAIKIKENIRKDYGDLTEMTESIRQHGVRKPLELGKDNELIDGHRRLKAAKAAGLIKVPYFYKDDKVDKITEQIIGGIFGKNLNAVEEGQAFVKYMKENRISTKDMAKKLNKTEGYVQKRIEIATLPKEIMDELAGGRIEIGHALLLKKMPEPDAKKFLKEIIKESMSVAVAKQGTHGQKLSEAPFNKEKCKGCKYNGSEQSELFETGKILNGLCLNKGCYTKKYQEHVKALKEKYRKVLFKGGEYEEPKGYTRGDQEFSCKEQGITEKYKQECRKKQENYLIKIDDSYGRLNVREYFKVKPKKIEEKPEKQQEKQRAEVLGNRIEQFKTNWLIGQCNNEIKAGSKESKILTLLNIGGAFDPEELIKMDEKKLDEEIKNESLRMLITLDMRELLKISSMCGVDIKEQFQITEEFLNLHTKDQLLVLMKEFKIDDNIEGCDRKEDFVTFILKSDIKGKVPKSML